MRNDAIGFFWADVPVVKVKKEVVRPVPPEPVWQRPDYLPNIDKARLYRPREMTDSEIWEASLCGYKLEYDIECYVNYAMFGFYCPEMDKYILLEKIPQTGTDFDLNKLKWILRNFEFYTFNGRNYDIPMSEAVLAGADCAQLKQVSDYIIQKKFDADGHEIKITTADVRRKFRLKKLWKTDNKDYKVEINHVDLKEVCPAFASLKTYSARMHTRLMQDLPFHHASMLTLDQIQVLRWYHGNDLHHTYEIRKHLKKEFALRIQLSKEYGIDLRSKSDAQIAEAVLRRELEILTGREPQGEKVAPGTAYRFQPAPWLKFSHPNMRYVFEVVKNLEYVVGEGGNIALPPELADMLIPLGDNGMQYQMGIGGLHSTEKKTAHFASGGYLLADIDVESFYPMLMLLLSIFPARHPMMMEVFRGIVNRRLQAKHAGDKSTANSLKIVVNGTYGKLGEKHSIIYRPDGIIQVCLNGQLSLLMLVERMVMAGIAVVSANTDGIVCKPHETQYALFHSIVAQWELETGLKMEETRYKMLLSRDVNNYIAIKDENAMVAGKKQSGGWKGKGAYLNFWHKDNIDHNEQLKHHPVNLVSQEAVIEFLCHRTPIEKYVAECMDVTKFIKVQQINKGAYKSGEYLGKTIRYYHGTKDKNPIINAMNGHRVGKSEGCEALMEMDGTLPHDLDRQWYVDQAYRILKEVAYSD